MTLNGRRSSSMTRAHRHCLPVLMSPTSEPRQKVQSDALSQISNTTLSFQDFLKGDNLKPPSRALRGTLPPRYVTCVV